MKKMLLLLLIFSANLYSLQHDPDIDQLEDFEFKGFLRNSFDYARAMDDPFSAEASICFVVEGILLYDFLYQNLTDHNREILERMSERHQYCSD